MNSGWWNEPEWSNPVRGKLAACGAMTGISWQARIYNPGVVSIGRGSRVDDFVHILGGEKITIGDRVHIASFVSVAGGGELELGSYSGLSAGVRIVTGSEDIKGGYLGNPTCPEAERNAKRGKVTIGKHCLIFTGAIILPGVEIGDGAVVGAGEVVRSKVPPWTILADGRSFARPGAEAIREREKAMVERYGF